VPQPSRFQCTLQSPRTPNAVLLIDAAITEMFMADGSVAMVVHRVSGGFSDVTMEVARIRRTTEVLIGY
jgi:hypothetical protein